MTEQELVVDCLRRINRAEITTIGDAAGIVAVQRETLQHEYLLRRAEALGVSAELARLLSGEIRPKRT